MSVRQITVRFPEIGYQRLSALCVRHGVSIRGLFEAAAAVAFDDEAYPERREAQLRIWEVIRLLEASAAYREGPRHRISVEMDAQLADRFQADCFRFGVSMNAAFAGVVMPWPEDSGDDWRTYRRQNIHRVIERARQLDFTRRARSPLTV